MVSYEKGSVFSNERLLGMIFSHLSFENLKTARLVNYLWNVEATKKLIHKFRTKPVQISADKATFPKGEKEINPSMTLNAFSKFIEKSASFPLTILFDGLFHEIHPAQKENVVNFFTWYGHIFKSLEVKEEIKEENRTFMEKLLTQLLPNLQVLTIRGCTDGLFLTTSFHFEKLKTLYLADSGISPVFLSAMLRFSKKLENIYLYADNYYYFYYNENLLAAYKSLKESNALHLLRNVDLRLDNSSFDFFEAFLSDENLINVQVIAGLSFNEGSDEYDDEPPFDWSRAGWILSAFFRKVCNSLTSMGGVNLLGQIPNGSLTRPIFPNVSRLGIDCMSWLYEKQHTSLFPGGLELATIFPFLTSITLNFMEFSEEFRTVKMCPGTLFPGNQSPLLTVQSLQINDHWGLPTSWVEFASRMFPNVVKADFGSLDDFYGASEFLWRLKHLEELQLAITIGYHEEISHKYDAAFTGFSPEIAAKLYKTSKRKLKQLNADELKVLRSRESIADLQKLRKLRAVFCDWRNVYRHSGHAEDSSFESQMILTHVSGRFAFNMCPQLLSNIHISLSHPETQYLCQNCCKAQDTFRTLVPFVQPISYNIDEFFFFDYDIEEPTVAYADEEDEYYYAKNAAERRLLLHRQPKPPPPSKHKQRKLRERPERKPRRGLERELKYSNAPSHNSSPQHFRL